MIRNLKALGLALVAVFAMSALAASAAQAVTTDGHFTSDGKVTVTGHSASESFTFEAGQSVTCTAHHTIMPENVTPWGPIAVPVGGLTTLTDQAHYKECVAKVGAQSLPATVTTNGCDFLFHLGETTAPLDTGTYTVTPTVKCGVNETIEVHVYQQASHATSVCTYKVGEQNLNPGTLHSTNIAGGTVKVSGEVTGITASRTGVLCGGTKHTSAAIQHANTTLTGKSEAGAATEISISH